MRLLFAFEGECTIDLPELSGLVSKLTVHRSIATTQSQPATLATIYSHKDQTVPS